nr:MAG TPA: hypothetical protein [Caudoviricetes sp.]
MRADTTGLNRKGGHMPAFFCIPFQNIPFQSCTI